MFRYNEIGVMYSHMSTSYHGGTYSKVTVLISPLEGVLSFFLEIPLSFTTSLGRFFFSEGF